MSRLEEEMVKAYVKYATGADNLGLRDPAIKQAFVDEVNASVPPADRMPADELLWKLINMRKGGHLPRVQRRYFGRNGKPPKPSAN